MVSYKWILFFFFPFFRCCNESFGMVFFQINFSCPLFPGFLLPDISSWSCRSSLNTNAFLNGVLSVAVDHRVGYVRMIRYLLPCPLEPLLT